jgi:hypothetical protein
MSPSRRLRLVYLSRVVFDRRTSDRFSRDLFRSLAKPVSVTVRRITFNLPLLKTSLDCHNNITATPNSVLLTSTTNFVSTPSFQPKSCFLLLLVPSTHCRRLANGVPNALPASRAASFGRADPLQGIHCRRHCSDKI